MNDATIAATIEISVSAGITVDGSILVAHAFQQHDEHTGER